jgi:hypothetical protein
MYNWTDTYNFLFYNNALPIFFSKICQEDSSFIKILQE